MPSKVNKYCTRCLYIFDRQTRPKFWVKGDVACEECIKFYEGVSAKEINEL